MLLLFVGGVMNLWVITALTGLVLVEKIAPFGARSSRVTGALLIGAGVWVLAGSFLEAVLNFIAGGRDGAAPFAPQVPCA